MATRSVFRRLERYVLGKVMGLIAWIIELRVVKAIKRGEKSTPQAPR